jgi:hypothetical protein
MASRNLNIDQLELDLWNPRINRAEGQHEVMQRIIDDQDIKLAVLAESISEEGLNPMDRLLVIKSERKGKYVVLEGNRRTLVLKVLNNPTVLTGLDVRPGLKRRLEKAAQMLDPRLIEPVSCFEIADRAEASTWLELRHSGESEGRGTVNWSAVARSRFVGGDPALQALDFVRQHARLTHDQKELLAGRFPITTLDRLLSTPAVRQKIGVEIDNGKLLTSLPAEEVLKPLRRMVLDLAEKKIQVDDVKTRDQQVKYVTNEVDRVDLSKTSGDARPLQGITEDEFPVSGGKAVAKRAQRATARNFIVPKHCRLNVTNAKTDEIYTELRRMRLDTFPNAIAVMLRVLMENSVDHYLTKVASPPIPLTFPTANGDKDKSLAKKIEDAMDDMVDNGANKKDFDGIRRGMSDKRSPLSVDLWNSYVHSRFVAATERELTVAWDGAQPFSNGFGND